MPCEVCDHTMQGLFAGHLRSIWWCPRCGTLKDETRNAFDDEPSHVEHSVSMLVDRARELSDIAIQPYEIGKETRLREVANDVRESCFLPEAR